MNDGSGAEHDDMLRRVLFLCSGNYYHSRICEELFNYAAAQRRLSWTAVSRALLPHPSQVSPGPMSPLAVHLLRQVGVAAKGESDRAIPEAAFERLHWQTRQLVERISAEQFAAEPGVDSAAPMRQR